MGGWGVGRIFVIIFHEEFGGNGGTDLGLAGAPVPQAVAVLLLPCVEELMLPGVIFCWGV